MIMKKKEEEELSLIATACLYITAKHEVRNHSLIIYA